MAAAYLRGMAASLFLKRKCLAMKIGIAIFNMGLMTQRLITRLASARNGPSPGASTCIGHNTAVIPKSCASAPSRHRGGPLPALDAVMARHQ